VSYTLKNSAHGVYFFVIEGEGEIESRRAGKRDATGVWDTDTVALSAKTELFLMAIEVPMTEA
jgi:hypothetical protein